jgi:membrane-bound lytic murein transglycosylase B
MSLEKQLLSFRIKSYHPHMTRGFILFSICLIIFSSSPTYAADFNSWLVNFRDEAARAGISQKTINEALFDIEPVQRAIELDKKQPEKKMTFQQYRRNVINEQRIQKGRQLIRTHARTLKAIEQAYGVQPQYIIALWGIESNFGANTGGFKVIPSLATLAWEGRRAEFFKKELINALKIIDQGHISAANMRGSWAGAMGQNQFMPSSFLAYAVDGDGDGRRDIWTNEIDVFASTANYLKTVGWTSGLRWGRQVKLPRAFPENLIGPKIRKPLSEWIRMGVKNPDGTSLPSDNIMASIVAPDGIGGPAYIVYANYQTIMDWNRSTYFATSVGLLADAIAR